jgi:hypothetical protein
MNSMYDWLKKPAPTPLRSVARDLCSWTSSLLVCRKLLVQISSPKLFFLHLVKHIPSWMPGAGFKRHALRTRIKVRTMHDAPYEMVQKTVAAGTAVPSFTSRLISDNLAAVLGPIHDEEDIKGVAGTLYGGTCVDRDDLPGAHTSHVLISCSGHNFCNAGRIHFGHDIAP